MTRTHDTLPQKFEERSDFLERMKERVRSLGVGAIKWALNRVENSYWKPGDRITRFTVFDDNATYDLSKTDGIIPNISETTPVDVIGGTMTVFAPGEEERVLRALRQEDQKQQ